ncbi:hypothetical protein [Pajaroellobacter abortibovis]|uniref:Uncharacterized protein n=1 Tax=Pajaroellobacter abortibovis TaxID=1882918 RepID=A0A1L6MYG8_9BACT|nr:hypothetical protein [Pajaroellobacter abortibovis]APS00526.1 hypothetical protein BCY86_07440 [Pajaroellobacter abortibovis]
MLRFSLRSQLLSSRLLKVGLYGFFVFGLGTTLSARSVYGHFKETALSIGQELTKLGDSIGTENRVRLNGELIHLSSTLTKNPMHAVLDQFEALCHEQSSDLTKELPDLSQTLQKKVPPLTPSLRFGIIREEEKNKNGFIACFTQDEKQRGVGILARMKNFIETGDLTSFGKFHYVVVKTVPENQTHVVSVWIDESFSIYRLFPKEGDAPGSDPEQTYRPPRTRRLLSATVEGIPYGVHIYTSPFQPHAIIQEYEQIMPTLGWEPVKGIQNVPGNVRAFMREGADIMISVERNEAISIISLIEIHSP